MPTTTPTMPSAEEAEAAKRALLDQAAAGDTIDPLELLRAEAAIGLAEQLVDHQARVEAEAREADRLRALDDLRDRARALDYQRVAAAHEGVVTALRELVTAGAAVAHDSRMIAVELRRHRPYPDDVDVGGTVGGRPDPNSQARTFAGVRLAPTNEQRLVELLVDAALHEAYPRGGMRVQAHRNTAWIREWRTDAEA